jgi:hypothetical protein
MTNREYLNSLLKNKEELFNNIALLTQTGKKDIVIPAIEEYNILTEFCRHLEHLIQTGILDENMEKKP